MEMKRREIRRLNLTVMMKVESNITQITKDKIQHVERAGTKLRFLLWTSDPWSKSKCQSIKCLICTNPFNSSFSCRKRNVSYKTYCLRCAEEAGANEKTLKSNINNSIIVAVNIMVTPMMFRCARCGPVQ